MLTPDYLDILPNEAVHLWQQVEDDILKDIGRRIRKMDSLTDTAKWQLWRLEQTQALQKDIIKILSKYSGKNEQIIRNLLVDACTESLIKEDELHKLSGKTIPPINDSPALVNLLNGGYKQTLGTWKNLTATTANTVAKQFENALDRAWLQLASGAFDYKTIIKKTVDELSQNMKFITYPTGHRDTLEVAVRRAVLTGVNQTAGKLSLERCEQMECDLVETTAHAGARPEHAEWQGKIFSRSGKSRKYPPFSSTGYGTGAGICGWNCRHSFYPFYEGLSKPAYSGDDLDKLNEKNIVYNNKAYSKYEVSQMQRALERKVRKYKKQYLIEDSAGVDTAVTAVKLKNSRLNLKEFVYTTNGRVDNFRTSTAGFGKSQAGKANWTAEKEYYNWLKSIGANNSSLNTFYKYLFGKSNNTKEYWLLNGYKKAVDKAEISPLVGLDYFISTAQQVENKIVGLITENGIEIESFTTHFIGRIIGQSEKSHKGMRMGVKIEDIIDTLKSPTHISPPRATDTGEIRQTFTGKNNSVTISLTDKRVIQCNPKK